MLEAKRKSLPTKHRQKGSATAMDFMLSFPIFAFLMLFFMQMALVLHAYTVVQHAAYSAARAARVHVLDVDHAFMSLDFHQISQYVATIPLGLRVGDALFGTNLSGWQDSVEHIHASAMNEVISISPARSRYGSGNQGSNWHEASFQRYIDKVTDTEGHADHANPIMRKARYAYDPDNTQIELSLIPDLEFSLAAGQDAVAIYGALRDKWNKLRNGELSGDGFTDWPVYITVTYRYQLQMPLGSYWFKNDDSRGHSRYMTAKVRLY